MVAPGPGPGMSPGIPSKEPWLGANLSLCFPGLGQWYAGARASGRLELGAGLVLMIGGGVLMPVIDARDAILPPAYDPCSTV